MPCETFSAHFLFFKILVFVCVFWGRECLERITKHIDSIKKKDKLCKFQEKLLLPDFHRYRQLLKAFLYLQKLQPAVTIP